MRREPKHKPAAKPKLKPAAKPKLKPKFKPTKDPNDVPLYKQPHFWTAVLTAVAGVAAVSLMYSALFDGPLGSPPSLTELPASSRPHP